jgi:hypothetical protein
MLNRILLVVRRNGESFAAVTVVVEGKVAFALPLSLLLCFEDLSLSDRCFLPWLCLLGRDMLDNCSSEVIDGSHVRHPAERSQLVNIYSRMNRSLNLR